MDLTSLEIGRRYRVDWRHEELRRTFRATGTLRSIEESPQEASDQTARRCLMLEVKPRFGKTTVQRVDVAMLRSIELA